MMKQGCMLASSTTLVCVLEIGSGSDARCQARHNSSPIGTAQADLHNRGDALVDPLNAMVVRPPREQDVPAAILLQHLVPEFHPPAHHTPPRMYAVQSHGAMPLACLVLRASGLQHAALQQSMEHQLGRLVDTGREIQYILDRSSPALLQGCGLMCSGSCECDCGKDYSWGQLGAALKLSFENSLKVYAKEPSRHVSV